VLPAYSNSRAYISRFLLSYSKESHFETCNVNLRCSVGETMNAALARGVNGRWDLVVVEEVTEERATYRRRTPVVLAGERVSHNP